MDDRAVQQSDSTTIKIFFGHQREVIGLFVPALAPDQQLTIEEAAHEAGRESGHLADVVRALILYASQTGRKLAIEGGAMPQD